jgi:hypothetical protein
MSDHIEPLPYMWLSAFYERLGRWNEAREAALKVLALDPLSYAALFRLSNVYEQEKDYVNALKHFELALSILPVFERSAHRSKIVRLKEQTADARASVARVDPFGKLPHEVILLVMQNGSYQNGDFVLRCTWVCRHWRESLINTPTLWGTLIFDPEEFRNKKTVEKRKAYIERSGKKVHTVEFNKLLLSTVGKFTRMIVILATQPKSSISALRHLLSCRDFPPNSITRFPSWSKSQSMEASRRLSTWSTSDIVMDLARKRCTAVLLRSMMQSISGTWTCAPSPFMTKTVPR